MLCTNTNTTFLIFLAYLIFTEFEPLSMFCHCKPRHTSLFLWRLVNKRIIRGRIRKDSSLFPLFFFVFSFCFVFRFFFHWVLGWSRHFFIWVVELPGWLPLQGYYQMILVFDGISVNSGEPNQHYLFHITAESNIQINISRFQLWFWHLQFYGGHL